MIEFKTEKGEFVVVELLESPPTIYHTLYGKKLELICKLSEATEENAKLIVDELRSEEYKYTDMVEQLHSLLTSKGIDINNGNWYLFKKI